MSKKDYGCFFCHGKSHKYEGTCDACGQIINIGSSLLANSFEEYKPRSIIGRGFNGWTIKVEDNFQPFAVKVIPKHRSRKAALPDTEARGFVQCSPHRNIARFVRQLDIALTIQGKTIEVHCMVFDYIPNAQPLSRLLEDETMVFSKADVIAILGGIASGLNRMHAHKLWHNDLHDDNILVRTVQPDENLPERFEAKLIDFGSIKTLSSKEQEHKERSDYIYLSKHIYTVTSRFEIGNQKTLGPADRSFTTRLRQIAQRLADPNISRRSLTPADVIAELRMCESQCATGHNYPSFKEMKEQSNISFTEPLANTNALNLEPQDIAPLFQDALGWRERINKSEPVFIVGPRGCGKTMFLRFLSIMSNARPLRNETAASEVNQRLQAIPHIGFLINIGQLRTPFLRSSFNKLVYQDPHKAEDFCREFLNTCFAFEVLRTCIWLHSEKLLSLTDDDLTLLRLAIQGLLDNCTTTLPTTVEALAEVLDRRVMLLSNLSDPDAYLPSGLCRDDVLHKLAQSVRRTNWGQSKEVWFMIDDYSVTVLPEIGQRAYNPVIFRLSSELRIKVSSEGEGPLLNDSLGRKYKEGRELTKLDFGEVYFQAKEEDSRRFFEQILQARFRETGKGSVQELLRLLGEHEAEHKFGNYILSKARPGDARFYGFGLLCRLCSGDVSFIIELLHGLTKGSWDGNRRKLSPKEQDDIIKRFAQRQLIDLHAIAEYGEKLHSFAFKLGNLIKEYLLKTKGTNADERLRIEIEGQGELCADAKRMHDALLRYSVLVSGGAGKSMAGLPTRKLYFRRLFSPCFPFSPNRHSCVAITIQEYEQWLLNPERIWNQPSESGQLL